MPNKDDSHEDDQNEELEDDKKVETSEEEDENLDDTKDTEEDNDDENEDDSEDEDSDEESEDEDEPKFKKAFSQIKGDTPEEYSQNLEEAYRKSSSEGKRLAQTQKEIQARLDSLTAIVEKNPDLKKAVEEASAGGENPTVDPALIHAREQMNRQMEEDYAKFAKDHPDIDTDEDVQAAVLEEVALIGEITRKKGKTISMEKALKRAWTNLGYDEDETKGKIALKAKEQASKSKNNSSNKKRTKPATLTPEQIKTGKRMGLSEKDLLATLEQ